MKEPNKVNETKKRMAELEPHVPCASEQRPLSSCRKQRRGTISEGQRGRAKVREGGGAKVREGERRSERAGDRTCTIASVISPDQPSPVKVWNSNSIAEPSD